MDYSHTPYLQPLALSPKPNIYSKLTKVHYKAHFMIFIFQIYIYICQIVHFNTLFMIIFKIFITFALNNAM